MSLLRSNLVVAAGTALSRVTGLLRLFVFGAVVGQTALTDAYLLGNETPNIIYDLLIGGVLSATLVPLLVSYMGTSPGDEGGDDEGGDERATNVIVTTSVVLMTGLTVVAVLAAPLVFRLYSLDPPPDVDVDLFRSVGTTLTRIFLIQILFYGLTGLANAYLQSRRHFLAAAWSPIVANLVIIASLLSLPDPGGRDWDLPDVVANDRLRWTLGLGATVGIAAMAAVVVPAAVRAGLRFRPVWDPKHPAVRKLLVMSGWTLGFVAANQAAVLVIRNLALGQDQGIATAYFTAFTFFVLPHGLLAVSISTTFQPEIARAVVARDRHEFIRHLSLGTRLIALLTLPAAAGLFVLRDPIVGLMVRGRFDATDAANTADALAGLSVGLVAFSIYLFVLRGFYAHRDTRTPFVINVGENLINIVLAIVLVGRWGVLGLGLAYAIAYLVSAGWAVQVLGYKVPGCGASVLFGGLWRPVLAAVLMAEAMWLVRRGVDDNDGWQAIAQLVVAGGTGLVVYVAVLFALRVPELDQLRGRLRRTG